MRSRLLLVIFGACAFSALAAAAAFYALSGVEASLLRIAGRELPTALSAQAVARQAQRLASAGPALLGLESLDGHAALSSTIADDEARLRQQLARLKGLGAEQAEFAGMEALAGRLHVNLGVLEILAINRIVLAKRRRNLLRRLFVAHGAAESALLPRIAVMEADVFALRKRVDDLGRRGGDRKPPTMTELSALLSDSTSLQAALAEASAVTALLVRAAASRRPEELEILEAPLRRALFQLETLTADLDPALREAVAAQARVFQTLFEGPESLMTLRGRELAQAATAEQRMAENSGLSEQLAEAADRLTARAQQNVETAKREAASMNWIGTTLLSAAVVLGLIGAILAARLYFARGSADG